jgi:hypothetical protein
VSNWKWTRDAAWTILVGLAAALFSLWLYHRGGGVILEQGPYYGSDIFRVRENLVHPDSPDKSYFRLSVHPLYGYVCVLAQALRKVFALGDYAAFAVLAFIQGGMLAALLFVSARAWGATSRLALGIVAFMCSTAGFVFWSSVTETHVWGGISILLFILMASWVPRRPLKHLGWQALAFVASCSMLITNGMLWGLSQVPFFARTRAEAWAVLRQPRTYAQGVLQAAIGVGLLALLYKGQSLFLPGVGKFLAYKAELQYVTKSGEYLFNGFNVVALFAPPLSYGFSWAVAANMLFGVAGVAAVALIVPRLRFACAFLAFALVFHSFFVRYQGFLFAPEYTAVACLVSGMALGRLLRERAPAVLLVAALLVAAVNVPGFITAAEDARAGRGSPRMGVQ